MKNLVLIVLLAILFGSFYACKDASELNKNNPPTAIFSYSPTNIDTATIVTFDASLSSDEEDPAASLTFSWDLTGKQDWTDPSSTPTINHMFTVSGSYDVSLKVMDSEGWSNTTTESVIVVDSIQ